MNIWSRISSWLPSVGNVVVMLLIVGAIGALAFGVIRWANPLQEGEIQVGMVVVFAIAALLVLLTITAAVFSRLNLANPRQALGLPEGSIRALIALFLIMIFIIMSVYLFRVIAGREGVPLTNLTATQVTQLGGQIFDVKQNDSGTFDVTLRVGVTSAAEQLALQLVTILGTLVTAVSAFYFGSSTASSARSQDLGATPALSVDGISPSSAKTGAGPITTEVTGIGFVTGAGVMLRQPGQSDVTATNVTVVNDAKIRCTFDLKSSQSGQWDVVVTTPDGRQATKTGLFQIQ